MIATIYIIVILICCLLPTYLNAQASASNTVLYQTNATTGDTTVIKIGTSSLADSLFHKAGSVYTLNGLLPYRQWFAAWLIQGLTDSLNNFVTLTNTGTSGNASYTSSTRTLNIPNYTASSPTYNSSPGRSLSTTGSNNTFTISSTKTARVNYTVSFAVALTLIPPLTSNAVVQLDYSIDAGVNWVPVSDVSQAFGVAVAITNTTRNNLSGEIPAGALVRIYNSANSNTTTTITRQQEVMY